MLVVESVKCEKCKATYTETRTCAEDFHDLTKIVKCGACGSSYIEVELAGFTRTEEEKRTTK